MENSDKERLQRALDALDRHKKKREDELNKKKSEDEKKSRKRKMKIHKMPDLSKDWDKYKDI